MQTFLWWANVATRVHEHYQSFFPPDVRYVADHARRAMTRFRCSDGVLLRRELRRARAHGVPAEEPPHAFVPDGAYPPNDLSWYANIPVPTSYMITGHRARISSAATTTRPQRESCTLPTTTLLPARSNGPGAITSSATPGTAASRITTAPTSS